MAETIAVGIALTTDPDKTRGLLDQFCRSLASATGMQVTAHGLWHYHHLLEALAGGELDLVWLPPILALRATGTGRVIPIALPVRHGVSTYSTALFARPDSRVRTLEDLKGVRAAWVDRQSASGYLVVRALLRSRGVDLDAAFSDEKFLGTHDGVAQAVLSGEVDVGATFVYLDPDASAGGSFPTRAGWGDARVHMVCFAGSIPSDVIGANKRLAERTRWMIQRALVDGAHKDLRRAARDLLGAESFVAPSNEHLESLVTILQNLEEARPAAHAMFPPPRRTRSTVQVHLDEVRGVAPGPETGPAATPGGVGDRRR
jgi:phosphonate transport system substrate-binding protein